MIDHQPARTRHTGRQPKKDKSGPPGENQADCFKKSFSDHRVILKEKVMYEGKRI
jgi:hypothetical protein